MTYETLLFLRNLCDRITIPVNDPNFRTLATQMITALDELDKEIANANNPVRQHTAHTGNTGRTGLSDPARLDP